MIHTALGIIGALMILSGYFLLISERMRETAPTYLGLNILGAALILVSLAQQFNLAATIMQAAWIVITIAGALLRPRPGQDSS